MSENIVLNTIYSRKSVRNYKENVPVSDDDINKILAAGMSAPSARNGQPWEFIVVKDRARLNYLAEHHPYAKSLYKAPVAIIVAGDSSTDMGEYWIQDTSAATENILLAAEALGLGALWMGVYPKEDRTQMVCEFLNLPENIIPLNLIAIGCSDGTEVAKNKWNPEKIHYEKW